MDPASVLDVVGLWNSVADQEHFLSIESASFQQRGKLLKVDPREFGGKDTDDMEHVVGINQGGQGQDPWKRKGAARLVLDSVGKVIRTQEFERRSDRNGGIDVIEEPSLCWAVVYVPRRPSFGRSKSGCSGP